MSLIPTDGHIVAGVMLDEHRFVGRMKAAQLFQVAIDPRRTEDLRQLEGNTELESLRRIRVEVQRLFEGAKAKNVEPYARYIVNVHEGASGMAPPIILFSERPLQFVEMEGDGSAKIQIPWDVQLVAIDGETQLAARFVAASIMSETRDDFVPIVICHGKPLDWARQVFHDLNLLGVRPNAAVGISMDERDPLTQVARDLEVHVPFFKGRVNMVRRQLRRSDPEVVTITALRGAVVTFALGITGVKYGAKPVPVDSDRAQNVQVVAHEWFDAVSRIVGPAIENRDSTVAAAPTVLAAVGALGHSLCSLPPARRSAEQDQLLAKLRDIDWKRGKHWEGIAGKYTPKGNFSIGGSKETAYTVYAAISDPSSPGYSLIRHGASTPAESASVSE